MAELIVEEPIRLVAETKGLAIGPRGKSAYQLAVENGFMGTVEQWLESLKGEPGQGETQIQSDYGQREDAKVDFIKNKPRYPKRWKGYADFGKQQIDIPIPQILTAMVVEEVENIVTTRIVSIGVASVINGKIGFVSEAIEITENGDGQGNFTKHNISWETAIGYSIEYCVLFFNNINPYEEFSGERCFVTALAGVVNLISGRSITDIQNGIFENAVGSIPEPFGGYPTNVCSLAPPSEIQLALGNGNGNPWNIKVQVRAMNARGQCSLPTERFLLACQQNENGQIIPALFGWGVVEGAEYYLVDLFDEYGNYLRTGITRQCEEDLWQFD